MASKTTRRKVSAWFPATANGSWERLAPRADVLSSVSIFGDSPDPDFFRRCADSDIATRKLVGGDASAFDTDAHARATIEGYLTRCEEDGFGGIDLDFEHIDARYRDRYSAFMRALAEELHARDLRLSICVGAIDLSMHGEPPDWMFHDPAVMAETCDEVRVMCYDMFCAPGIWYGPTSTRLWAREGMRFWLDRVPRESLLMALPAYSNDYDTTPGSGNGRQQGLDSPAAIEGAHQIECMWSDYDAIHIYRYLDAQDRPRLFFASDADSTRWHLRTVEELDLPGISFWHYGTISDGIWEAVLQWLS